MSIKGGDNVKKLICVILFITIIIFTALSATAYNRNNTADFCYTDYSGTYMIECYGYSATITKYTDAVKSIDISLDKKIDAVCGYGGRILFLSNDELNNQLIVNVYSINNDTFDNFAIYGIKLYNDTDFCCDNNYFYIENPNNPKELRKYTLFGSLVKTYSFNSNISSAVCGYRDGAYISCQKSLYRISGDSFDLLSNSVSSPLFLPNDNYIVNSYGSVYISKGDYLFDVYSDNNTQTACVINGVLYCPNGTTIYGYDIATGEKTSKYNTGSNVSVIYPNNGAVISVNTSGDRLIIKTSDFTDLRKPNSSTEGRSDTDNKPADKHISSSVYNIDLNKLKISGIPSGTTVAKLRSNIDYPGYSLTIYSDNTVKKSGNIGTAMTAEFVSDTDSYTFELSVIGDITGEGNVNSRDLKLLMDYLTGAADFNGAYSISADLSKDGKVDVKDLAMMNRSCN